MAYNLGVPWLNFISRCHTGFSAGGGGAGNSLVPTSWRDARAPLTLTLPNRGNVSTTQS